MKVNLDKVFHIAAPASSAWAFLQHIEGVAGCMPGAEITEKVDEQNYKGKVKSKFGPATMVFNGDIEVKSLHSDEKKLHMLGSGQDSKGSSSAEMDLTAWVVEVDSNSCELHGKATVTVNGKAASLGGRMMVQIADQILNQFGENFADNTIALGGGEEAESAKEKLAEQPKELNGFAFAWSIVVGFIKSLFGAKNNTPSV